MAEAGNAPNELVRLAVEQLKPGLIVDKDIYYQGTRLLASGTTITSGMIIGLKQRLIEYVDVQPESDLAALAAEPATSSPIARLLARSADVYALHNMGTAVPERWVVKRP